MPGFLKFQGGPQESTDTLNQALNVGWSFAEKLRVSWKKEQRRCWNRLSKKGIEKLSSPERSKDFPWNLPKEKM